MRVSVGSRNLHRDVIIQLHCMNNAQRWKDMMLKYLKTGLGADVDVQRRSVRRRNADDSPCTVRQAEHRENQRGYTNKSRDLKLMRENLPTVLLDLKHFNDNYLVNGFKGRKVIVDIVVPVFNRGW